MDPLVSGKDNGGRRPKEREQALEDLRALRALRPALGRLVAAKAGSNSDPITGDMYNQFAEDVGLVHLLSAQLVNKFADGRVIRIEQGPGSVLNKRKKNST